MIEETYLEMEVDTSLHAISVRKVRMGGGVTTLEKGEY